jgi:hypothetical protein
LIARVQLRHKVAGHAFVWVSREDGTPHTMEGYVYQTNIGIRTQEFDLLEWINDPKSEQSVYFPAYITQLQAAFGKELPGQSGSEGRASVYTDNFLAEGKAIPDATAMKEAPAGEIKILWKAVSDAESLARLLEV